MRVHRSVPEACGLFLILISLSTLPALAQCNSNDTGAPCFAGNTDILGGRGSLLRNDDLVFASTGATTPIGANLNTTNSTITQTTPSSLNNVGIAATANMIVVRGRLFDVDHDQILSAGVTRVDLDRKYLASLEGSDSSIAVPSLSVLVPPSNIRGLQLLYGASGDFFGNGYDQMVVMAARDSQLMFQTLAAVNPESTSSGLQVGTMSGPVSNISGAYAMAADVFSDPQPGTPLPPARLAVLSRSSTTNQGLIVTFYAVDSQLNVSPTGQSITLTLPSGA